MIILRR